ncbi:flagellar basal-body rod protein FlgB [Aneurinibacillus aneurinilyticus ATCC 12856]|uniref:Flagellar basal body rod protein FlgB n=2 Tax=Aneurinibacillus aneurinilyticus TaxID=1391 RepID=U1X3T8_ANEAE|nr:flagellar basal-body rod protein FlgB [Aneurinibacillus aneurinilyticus ATCC 12856]
MKGGRNMLSTPTMSIFEKALDAATLRHQAISNNIANVNTPHYRTQSVAFEDELQKAMAKGSTAFTAYRTNEKHISFGMPSLQSVGPKLRIDEAVGPMQNAANNVDLDFEMTNLARNQLWYNALVQQASGQYNKLRTVIGGK